MSGRNIWFITIFGSTLHTTYTRLESSPNQNIPNLALTRNFFLTKYVILATFLQVYNVVKLESYLTITYVQQVSNMSLGFSDTVKALCL